MVEIVRAELGMHERDAFEVAKALVRGLRKRYGGMRIGSRGCAIYIPAPSKTERNAAICREFDGTNVKELMQRHGIKRTQIYRIVGARVGGGGSAKNPIFRQEMGRQ
ncbi:Mor transcription activator family protein [Comamonas sp.]|uniref:Mor transcription activator family protein n=1 Tax=Comamonas sp. TaxID=34028 RepID=UPI00258322A2|nr:Mor transcription activator family protein [Comamonas sp.]